MKGNPVPIVDHNKFANLNVGDFHTQYSLSAGRSGGLVQYGSPDSGDDYTLYSNLSKDGLIKFGDNSAYDEASVMLGIGIADGILGKLHIQTEGEIASIYLDAYSDSPPESPTMVIRRARGSIGSEAAIQLDDYIFNFTGRGYNGSAFTGTKVLLRMGAEEDWDETSNGTFMGVHTTAPGTTTRAEKFRFTGDGPVRLLNAAAEPSSSPAGLVQLWAYDVSASSELKVRDEAGNVTTLSPHPADFMNSLPVDNDHQVPFAYSSENVYIGKKIQIDMELLAREVERLSGKSLVTVTTIETEDWDINQDSIKTKNTADRLKAQTTIDDLTAQIADASNDKAKTILIEAKNDIIVPDAYIKKIIPAWLASRI